MIVLSTMTSRPCLGCSATPPRNHRFWCDYCSNRLAADIYMRGPQPFYLAIREAEARERMAKMDRAERPRVTKDTRELAKPHPWQCDEYGP